LPNIDPVFDSIIAERDGAKQNNNGSTNNQPNGGGGSSAFGFDQEAPRHGTAGEDEISRIRSALPFIRGVDNRETWFNIGAALHFNLGEAGRPLWDLWSATSSKYDADQDKTWRSYKRGAGDNVITIATLFKLAMEGGWRPSGTTNNRSSSNNKSTASPHHDWDDPDTSILDTRRGELPAFPIDVFTSKSQECIERSAHGAGVSNGHVAVPLLGIASSLIGTGRRVQASRSWSQPLTCWTSVVGFSGTGKTPGLDVSRRALAEIERARAGKIVELQCAHETKVETAKAARAKWKKAVEEATEKNMPPPTMPAAAFDPGQFITPRLYISDATIERLAVLLQVMPRGALLLSDELAGLFLNMSRYSAGQDNEFWLEAWNGAPYAVERMGRPALSIGHLLIGICGGLQPDKLAQSFDGAADGMYARVLFSWPEEPPYRKLRNDVAELEGDIINAFSRLIDLRAEENGALVPKYIPLSMMRRHGLSCFGSLRITVRTPSTVASASGGPRCRPMCCGWLARSATSIGHSPAVRSLHRSTKKRWRPLLGWCGIISGHTPEQHCDRSVLASAMPRLDASSTGSGPAS
jgi:hypothetical protein